jgi:bacteriorhodopsin
MDPIEQINQIPLQENMTKKETQDRSVVSTFRFSLAFMLFAFSFTLFATFYVKNHSLRRILYLECFVTFVSCCVYTLFNTLLQNQESINDAERKRLITTLNTLRYIGWSITTPIMMSVLCIALASNLKMEFPSSQFLISVIFLDYFMLLFGILGEIGVMGYLYAMIIGFIPFFMMFYIVFAKYVYGKKNPTNYFLFAFYFVLWLMYGLVYIVDPKIKTMATNALDITSKGVLAIILSIQYLLQN